MQCNREAANRYVCIFLLIGLFDNIVFCGFVTEATKLAHPCFNWKVFSTEDHSPGASFMYQLILVNQEVAAEEVVAKKRFNRSAPSFLRALGD